MFSRTSYSIEFRIQFKIKNFASNVNNVKKVTKLQKKVFHRFKPKIEPKKGYSVNIRKSPHHRHSLGKFMISIRLE